MFYYEENNVPFPVKPVRPMKGAVHHHMRWVQSTIAKVLTLTLTLSDLCDGGP